MADQQSNLSKFIKVKAAFLDKVRNVMATNGIMDGLQQMEEELVSNLKVLNTRLLIFL